MCLRCSAWLLFESGSVSIYVSHMRPLYRCTFPINLKLAVHMYTFYLTVTKVLLMQPSVSLLAEEEFERGPLSPPQASPIKFRSVPALPPPQQSPSKSPALLFNFISQFVTEHSPPLRFPSSALSHHVNSVTNPLSCPPSLLHVLSGIVPSQPIIFLNSVTSSPHLSPQFPLKIPL